MANRPGTEEPFDNHDDVVLAAALAWGAGVGPAGFRKLVAGCGSLQAILSADAATLHDADPRLTTRQAERITYVAERLDEFADQISGLRQSGVQILSISDPQYPQLLTALRNPPPVICIRGALLERDRTAVAVVGTRRANPEEVARTHSMVRAFAAADITVVSGLAVGVDGAAHRAALRAGGRTIAVIGSGLDWTYPPEHTDLAEQVAESGALVSELAPDARVAVGTLMARNRIIAALAAVTVVVASGTSGGSLVTAEEAVRLGKPVAAFNWGPTHTPRPGNQMLLDSGGVPVEDDSIAQLCDLVHEVAARPVQTVSIPPPQHDGPQMELFS